MPADIAIIVAMIAMAFVLFAVALARADFNTRNISKR